jgi:hypothetical protein
VGRDREYNSNADRQRAYRARVAEEQKRMRDRLRAYRDGAETKAMKRDRLSKRLVRILGMLGSDAATERDKAAREAARMVKEAGLTWYDVLNVTEDK